MKTKVLFFVLFSVILMPLGVSALAVNNVNVSGSSEQTVGDYFNLNVSASFSGLNKNSSSSDGVYTVAFEIETDDTVLEIISGYSNGYDTVISKYEGKYYVVSTINDSVSNKCLDGFLSCGNYNGSVKFFVRNTTKDSVNIKITELAVIGYKVDLDAEYYNSPIEATHSSNTSQYMKIKQSTSGVVEEPKSTVQNTKPAISNNKKVTTKSDTTNNSENNNTKKEETQEEKSTNKHLEYLKIKGYNIKFKKDKLSYEITVPKKVNSLEIEAKTLDEKATYKIVGNNKLEKSENTIKVIVTAENGDKLTYFINVVKNTENKESFNKVTNKLNKVIIIIVIVVVIISILVGIISYRNKKKLIKMIDES